MVEPLTFSNHAWDAEFGTISYMNERVENTHKKADQHSWLGRCVTPLEVVLLREDVFVQSSADAIFLDSLDEESYIRSIITDKGLSRANDSSWILTHRHPDVQ
jgi:hypothetical protein